MLPLTVSACDVSVVSDHDIPESFGVLELTRSIYLFAVYGLAVGYGIALQSSEELRDSGVGVFSVEDVSTALEYLLMEICVVELSLPVMR